MTTNMRDVWIELPSGSPVAINVAQAVYEGSPGIHLH
jgi:hypothetical protein